MWKAIATGLAGASTVTLLNETIRQVDEEAPRLDLLGMRALAEVASPDNLRTKAFMGDIASNTAYYAIVAAGPPDKALACGAALGLAAGVGAVYLPGRMGLGDDVTNRDSKRRLLSVAYYGLAGLFAGWTFQCLARRE